MGIFYAAFFFVGDFMATIQEIANRVLQKTRRFDQAAEHLSETILAVRWLHAKEKWDKDLVKARFELTYDDDGLFQSEFDIPENFRTYNLLKPVIPGGIEIGYLNAAAAENLFALRKQGRKKYNNTFFIHGNAIVVYCTMQPTHIDMSYYARPTIPNGEYSDWVTQDYDHIIYHYVAGKLFAENDHMKQAQAMMGFVSDYLADMTAVERTT